MTPEVETYPVQCITCGEQHNQKTLIVPYSHGIALIKNLDTDFPGHFKICAQCLEHRFHHRHSRLELLTYASWPTLIFTESEALLRYTVIEFMLKVRNLWHLVMSLLTSHNLSQISRLPHGIAPRANDLCRREDTCPVSVTRERC